MFTVLNIKSLSKQANAFGLTFVLCFLLCACSSNSNTSHSQTKVANDSTQQADAASLSDNCAESLAPIYLVNGNQLDFSLSLTVTITDPELTGASAKQRFALIKLARGDINQDKKPDRIAVIAQTGAGSGTFYYLAAALAKDCVYQPVPGEFIGDRIDVQELKVLSQPAHEYDKGMIVLNIGVRQNNQAMSQPQSLVVSRLYKLQDNRLINIPQY